MGAESHLLQKECSNATLAAFALVAAAAALVSRPAVGEASGDLFLAIQAGDRVSLVACMAT